MLKHATFIETDYRKVKLGTYSGACSVKHNGTTSVTICQKLVESVFCPLEQHSIAIIEQYFSKLSQTVLFQWMYMYLPPSV